MTLSAEEVWKGTIAQIPGLFERLLYLGEIRNSVSGMYEHHGLILRFGAEAADAAILSSHEQTFLAWLAQPLETRVADVELYLARKEMDRATAVRHWTESSPCAVLTPATVRDSERDLCAQDFKAMLDVMRTKLDIRRPDPEDR